MYLSVNLMLFITCATGLLGILFTCVCF